jgi:hypothetical protein
MLPSTLDELKQQVRKLAGTDFGAHSPRWSHPLRRRHPAGRALSGVVARYSGDSSPGAMTVVGGRHGFHELDTE